MSIGITAPCETESCMNSVYKVHAGTLREYVKRTRANFSQHRLQSKKWVDVCPKCDAYALGAELTNPCPVYSPDGVIRVVDELLEPDRENEERILHFAFLSFTQSAFESACLSTTTHLPERVAKRKVEADLAAARLIDDISASNALAFSESVCLWGGGSRVWGKMKKLNSKGHLGSLLSEWLNSALHGTLLNDELIAYGNAIPGLGISFASKHLRILCPDRHAVLDEVVSKGFGFANNPAGYRLFLQFLHDFKIKYNLEMPLSEIESALFYLVRQDVRSV